MIKVLILRTEEQRTFLHLTYYEPSAGRPMAHGSKAIEEGFQREERVTIWEKMFCQPNLTGKREAGQVKWPRNPLAQLVLTWTTS